MYADLTRDTFHLLRSRQIRRVLIQQGRLQLDADWNEQVSILLDTLSTYARDLFGEHAGPASLCGFGITLDDNKTPDVLIGSGRYYVGGVLVQNDEPIAYSKQRGYPFADSPTLDDLKKLWNTASVLFYLDVWERHVTAIEEPGIREVALNGADTATRAQVVWQVKALEWKGPDVDPDDAGFFASFAQALDDAGWSRPGTANLLARARHDKPSTDVCTVSPDSRFRGPENQLYRVEIHKGGNQASGFTFKWSRENGSVVFPVLGVTVSDKTTRVQLGAIGRDIKLGLKENDWVELLDDASILGLRPGPLFRVAAVDPDEMTATLAGEGPAFATGRHTQLRRWDHVGDAASDGALPGGKDWIALEDGIGIMFQFNGTEACRPGDYWLIPARVATGDVEWPGMLNAKGEPMLDADRNPLPQALPPWGGRHYYAPLALCPPNGSGKPKECRRMFNHVLK